MSLCGVWGVSGGRLDGVVVILDVNKGVLTSNMKLSSTGIIEISLGI